MEVIEYFSLNEPVYWLNEIAKSDWSAGQSLVKYLKNKQLKQLCGEQTKLFLLVENQVLLAFCTLAEQDDILAPELKPWVGFVYTFPAFRGNHYSGILLKKAQTEAQALGYKYLYVSTNDIGLYEKYGYEFYELRIDKKGENSRIYRLKI